MFDLFGSGYKSPYSSLSFVGPFSPAAAFVSLDPDTRLQGSKTHALYQHGPRLDAASISMKKLEKKWHFTGFVSIFMKQSEGKTQRNY